MRLNPRKPGLAPALVAQWISQRLRAQPVEGEHVHEVMLRLILNTGKYYFYFSDHYFSLLKLLHYNTYSFAAGIPSPAHDAKSAD
jgi:hypothetical protein